MENDKEVELQNQLKDMGLQCRGLDFRIGKNIWLTVGGWMGLSLEEIESEIQVESVKARLYWRNGP